MSSHDFSTRILLPAFSASERKVKCFLQYQLISGKLLRLIVPTKANVMKKIKLIGICCDHNSSFLRGPAAAPEKIRSALYSGSANLCSESGINFKNILDRDIGDLHVDENTESYLSIENSIASHASRDDRLLVLGGDHSVTYPVVRALANIHGPLAILHFDAHPDLYESFNSNRYAHACPFARILEEGLAEQLVQVGIRTLNKHQEKQAARYGVQMHLMRDFNPDTFAPAFFNAPVYISLDLDVFDPAYAPGVSHHEPGGLSTRDVLDIIHQLDCNVVGADIVEYNPERDHHDMTAMVAAKFVKELGAKMAERQHGLSQACIRSQQARRLDNSLKGTKR